jgi:hypothetical protein
MISTTELSTLRRVITENLRVQRGGADHVPYIDVSNALIDVSARQNHAIFGRRGCGKPSSSSLHKTTWQVCKDNLFELRRFQNPFFPECIDRNSGCSVWRTSKESYRLVWKEESLERL